MSVAVPLSGLLLGVALAFPAVTTQPTSEPTGSVTGGTTSPATAGDPSDPTSDAASEPPSSDPSDTSGSSSGSLSPSGSACTWSAPAFSATGSPASYPVAGECLDLWSQTTAEQTHRAADAVVFGAAVLAFAAGVGVASQLGRAA